MEEPAEKPKHPSLVRLLEVAGERGAKGHAALASALNEFDQTVTNWAKRGVSRQGALSAQGKFGCSAKWVLEGLGPKWVGADVANPAANEDKVKNALTRMTAAEDDMLADIRDLTDEDRIEFAANTSTRTAWARLNG